MSYQSSPFREPTPEVDITAMHNALAPEAWDAAEWDYSVRSEASEDEAPLTDGEADLQFLADGELEGESADDAFSWGEDLSPSEEEEAGTEDETSSGEYPPLKRFRAGSWDDSDDDDEEEDEDEDEVSADRYLSGDEHLLGSADEGDDGDDERGDVEDEESSSSSSDSEEEESDDEDGSDGSGSAAL
jgi:hypothetical protein